MEEKLTDMFLLLAWNFSFVLLRGWALLDLLVVLLEYLYHAEKHRFLFVKSAAVKPLNTVTLLLEDV